MTVIDLREMLTRRDVKIIAVDSDSIYYTERFSVNNADTLYFYSYDLFDNAERMISYVTLDENFANTHYFTTENNIIAVCENGGSKALILRLCKKTKGENFHRTVPIIGSYTDSVLLDDNNLVIYSAANSAYKDVFDRCFQDTGSRIMANMYDLDNSYRYFMRDFRTAAYIRNGLHIFTDSRGKRRVLLSDTHTAADEKERLYRSGKCHENMYDKIFQITLDDLIESIRSSSEKIRLKCIAAAGLKGTVSLEYAGENGIVFTALSFGSGEDWFVGMSATGGNVRLLCPKRRKDGISRYFTDEEANRIFYMTPDGEKIFVKGAIGSRANLTYPCSIGQFINCADDRFIIADGTKNEGVPLLVVYDSAVGTSEKYSARFCVERGNVVVY